MKTIRFLEIDTLENGDDLADELIKEFGEPFFKGSKRRGSPLWYADQSLFSYKLDKWRNKRFFVYMSFSIIKF